MIQWLSSVKTAWFARTTPDPVDLPTATTATRERQRKARLLSICICCMFAFVTPVIIESIIDFPLGIINASVFEVALIFAIILNRHDKLEIATSILLAGYILDVAVGQWLYSPNSSAAFLWEWTGLLIPALLAGLILPFWTTFLFGIVTCILNTLLYVTWHRYGIFISHLPISDHVDFLIYIYLITGGTTMIGAVYARSLEKAVTSADRAAELGQAYNQLAEANRQLEQLAHYDPTTGLLNHRSLNERLAQEHERAVNTGASLAVIFTDIDHFKHINDTWGHQVGDLALMHVAACLRSATRVVDIIARYGGEEFVVVLPGLDHSAALQMAERLRQLVEAQQLVLADGRCIPITMSIGVAIFPDDEQSADDLIVAADTAMYHAKHSGRNRVCVAERASSRHSSAA